ncbi:hypothetical protein B0T14DRAFT_159439 [Immersiella caudata]|uniref:Uncharacterized protein n=1 Tax=Immersiella caudata TaxID=314043 RepID=A0AA39WWT9_9PEZI|nr:hypothetical protein B0T14DRAFT_159439 [Immersiella caudata]
MPTKPRQLPVLCQSKTQMLPKVFYLVFISHHQSSITVIVSLKFQLLATFLEFHVHLHLHIQTMIILRVISRNIAALRIRQKCLPNTRAKTNKEQCQTRRGIEKSKEAKPKPCGTNMFFQPIHSYRYQSVTCPVPPFSFLFFFFFWSFASLFWVLPKFHHDPANLIINQTHTSTCFRPVYKSPLPHSHPGGSSASHTPSATRHL